MTAPATPVAPAVTPAVTPAAPSYRAPADGGRPLSAEALVTDEFVNEVVQGYDKGLPDRNDPNETEQVPASEPGKGNDAATKAKAPEKPAETPAETPPADEPKSETPDATAKAEEKPSADAPAKLAAEFTLFDADGDELDIADVMGKIKEIGIPYKGEVRKMPLDRVVRLAQSGFRNEQLYQQAEEAIQRSSTLESDFEAANDSIARQNKFIETLLTDDAARDAARARLQALNTPEARAERAEREAAQLRASLANRGVQATAATFWEQEVQPALDKIMKEFPALSPEEVVGRFNIATAKLGAVIQPKDFEAVRALLKDDFPAWAAGLQETRASQSTEIRKVKESNTLLKKKVNAGVRPTGRVATSTEAKPAKKPARPMSDEMFENLVDSALADDT